ncbi:HAMP domain-containing sensor histidine kinase [Bacillus sp. 31A1R]|uniref:histidine kinase n=1 Tax=Robertmurraya mangrovi TaxID=3098077 RepID=A0ABU5J3N4_9BACI|nr:HAMP domain-containing sensor histidine kinase [Bacillus sp. 31A1R]MDZ5473981.1 HAMP domain-containing sensor histidine kinase [Bacillus sp. 31A1R]
MDYMKDLLLNLLILLSTMLIFQVAVTDRYRSFYDKNKLKLLFFIAIFQMILAMVFTIQIQGQFIYDFRLIPILLGGLYGGPRVSIFLFLFLLAIRMPIGGAGVYNTLYVFALVTITTSLLSSMYKRWRTKDKLLTVMLLTILFSAASFVFPIFFMGFDFDPYFIFMFAITQTIGAVMIAFSSELIIKNHLLHMAVLKSEKMEVISQLAASISHEVRNPLTVTRGFLQLLKDHNIEPIKRSYYLDTALEELNRAEVIISDYLTFAKPHPSDINTIYIKDVINKAVELIIPYANHYSVRVLLDGKEDAPVKGDASKVQQCLINILKNGVEAMPQGGILSIRLDITTNFCYIHIVDSGIGMTEEEVARLGEPYFSTKEGKGTGLGMMVVFRIIEGMNGKVEIKSKVGKGTHFIISIPTIKI